MNSSDLSGSLLKFGSLRQQDEHAGLPLDLVDVDADFTIFNLKDLHHELPFRLPFSRLNFFVFIFVKDGYGKYSIDDHTYFLEPGMVYFTNPGHYRSVEYTRIEEVYVVTVSEAFLKENTHAHLFEDFPFLLAETFPSKKISDVLFVEFEELYLQILRAHHSASLYRRRVTGSLFTVILFKFKELYGRQDDQLVEGEWRSVIVTDFKRLLEKHYRDLGTGLVSRIFQVQDYALALNLHPNYLSNVISNKTGKPVGVWISEKTIAESRALLLNTTDSIKEIAYRLGFLQAAHFSNYFKKHVGASPLEYRRRQSV